MTLTPTAHRLLVASITAIALVSHAHAQETKGPSEKDCRNLNFPTSEERLIRACNASFSLCASPPPAWQQTGQVMRVCDLIKRETQLQAALPGQPARLLARPLAPAIAPTTPAVTAPAASLSAQWRLNGNGYPGEVMLQQAADGTLSGTIYGNPLTGFHSAGDRSVVWLRGAPTRPDQAFVGSVSADGNAISGRMFGLTVSGGGVGPARNVFAFSALRAAPNHPGHPGLPAAAAGPASVAGTHQFVGNGHLGQLNLTQAPDGSLSGNVYGNPVDGHYAAGSGSIAFIRYSAPGQPFQLFVGSVTPQGMRGELLALNGGAGASAQRMRYDWSAQPVSLAQAQAPATAPAPPAAQPATAPFAANAGIAGGQILASINEPTAAQCLARCRGTAGCTAFQFAGGAFGGPGLNPPNAPGASCTLFAGSASLRPLQGVTACLMPCDGSQQANAMPNLRGARDLTGATPGGRTAPSLVNAPPVEPPPQGAFIGPAPAMKAGMAVLPPPAPTPAAPVVSPPAPGASGPAPAAPVARLTGFQIVTGPQVTIAPLSIADAVASCPASKVVLSVGYRISPTNADPQFGAEVKGAMPDGASGRVRIRNANVFVPIQAEAHVVCVDAVAGVRAVRTSYSATSDRVPALTSVNCGADRVIGGGFMGETESHPVANGPMPSMSASTPNAQPTFGLASASVKTTPLPGRFTTEVVGICAQPGLVPDWEPVMGPLQTIGGRSTAGLSLQCPAGKRMLARGIAHGGWLRPDRNSQAPNSHIVSDLQLGNAYPLALITNLLLPQDSRLPSGQPLAGGGASGFVSNRDLAGNTVVVTLAGVCATVP